MAETSFEPGTSRSRILRSAAAPHWLAWYRTYPLLHFSELLEHSKTIYCYWWKTGVMYHDPYILTHCGRSIVPKNEVLARANCVNNTVWQFSQIGISVPSWLVNRGVSSFLLSYMRNHIKFNKSSIQKCYIFILKPTHLSIHLRAARCQESFFMFKELTSSRV